MIRKCLVGLQYKVSSSANLINQNPTFRLKVKVNHVLSKCTSIKQKVQQSQALVNTALLFCFGTNKTVKNNIPLRFEKLSEVVFPAVRWVRLLVNRLHSTTLPNPYYVKKTPVSSGRGGVFVIFIKASIQVSSFLIVSVVWEVVEVVFDSHEQPGEPSAAADIRGEDDARDQVVSSWVGRRDGPE